MNTKTTLSISEARKKIFEIAEEVQKPGKQYTLTEKGKPKVVIMSAEEFESWKETLDVMQDFPDLKTDIAQAESEYSKGEYITWDQFKKSYDLVADKSKKKYEVSSNTPTKGTKRITKSR